MSISSQPSPSAPEQYKSALWKELPGSITHEARRIEEHQLLANDAMRHAVVSFLEQCMTLSKAVEHYQEISGGLGGGSQEDRETVNSLHHDTQKILCDINEFTGNLRRQSMVEQFLRKAENIKTLQGLSEEVSRLSSHFMTTTLLNQGDRIAKIGTEINNLTVPS